jgi:hypothetical protein
LFEIVGVLYYDKVFLLIGVLLGISYGGALLKKDFQEKSNISKEDKKKSMIVSISKELCLGRLRNASVVYIMVN